MAKVKADIDSDGEVFTWNIGRAGVNDRLYKLTPDLVPVKYVTPRTDERFHGGVSLLDDGHVVAVIGPKERVGNKGGSLSNRLRAVLAKS